MGLHYCSDAAITCAASNQSGSINVELDLTLWGAREPLYASKPLLELGLFVSGLKRPQNAA
jgi:hypothetical protein